MKQSGFGIKSIVVVAVLSVLVGIFLTARFDMTNQSGAQNFWRDGNGQLPSGASPAMIPNNFVEIAKRLSPTVVNISTTQIMKDLSFPPTSLTAA